jgi:hypothetical protein
LPGIIHFVGVITVAAGVVSEGRKERRENTLVFNGKLC